MPNTPELKVPLNLGDLPAWCELLNAAGLVVQVTPRSPEIDRLQEAVVAVVYSPSKKAER